VNQTLNVLTGRRAWYVPGVSIWGNVVGETIDAVATEADDGTTRVVFYQFPIAGTLQDIEFTNLIDHRGNSLPMTISGPVVIPIPRNTVGVAILGKPGSTALTVGKTEITSEDGLVDFWIVEAGT
jgi:hypothetical protein